jgi:alkylation response protein AidB-like acyl-CoA dehydrogenase
VAHLLSEEHELLRQTVRDLAEAKIAPAAGDVDAKSRFPQEALDALTSAGLHAAHIPESYGGEGADALAAVIIIEEVARACASSSLIPRSTSWARCRCCCRPRRTSSGGT